jgi:hypothetical protein
VKTLPCCRWVGRVRPARCVGVYDEADLVLTLRFGCLQPVPILCRAVLGTAALWAQTPTQGESIKTATKPAMAPDQAPRSRESSPAEGKVRRELASEPHGRACAALVNPKSGSAAILVAGHPPAPRLRERAGRRRSGACSRPAHALLGAAPPSRRPPYAETHQRPSDAPCRPSGCSACCVGRSGRAAASNPGALYRHLEATLRRRPCNIRYQADATRPSPHVRLRIVVDEARRVAMNIARLPEVLGKTERDRTGSRFQWRS